MKIKKQTGFTLIELMVTVAIVGILASIAYPSFQEQIRRTRRADAQGALLGLSNAMERFFTVNNTYVGTAASGPPGPPAATLYPSKAPLDGATKYYDLTISVVSASPPSPPGFTLQAAPISTSAQNGDKCGTFTLTNTGVRDITGGLSGVTKGDCWK